MIEPAVFEAQVKKVIGALEQLADGLAADGQLEASVVAFAGRQAIRALWTQLHPPAQAAPDGAPPPAAAEEAPPGA